MSIETTSGADGSGADEPDDGDSYGSDPYGYDDATTPIRVTRPGRARRRRVLLISGLVLGGLLVIGAVWLFFTALIARSQLQEARAEIPELRAALLAGDHAKA